MLQIALQPGFPDAPDFTRRLRAAIGTTQESLRSQCAHLIGANCQLSCPIDRRQGPTLDANQVRAWRRYSRLTGQGHP
ncbi:hypothetical protein [Stenotrophomonas sp. MMGLT7]|uniref:hypothetical protein n=1 Tax=Stenotrophomonas sp. MMGLT7 TaxID=2901227 RepID=UPI001E55C447|nr:hypothetical protein [Stenotrophomonas sp. MMGLT7]MCD7097824.1 hypothetical protein [Stenotrophomonas sp. MMGLT7]